MNKSTKLPTLPCIMLAICLPIISIDFDFSFLTNNNFLYLLSSLCSVQLLGSMLISLNKDKLAKSLAKLTYILIILTLIALITISLQLLRLGLLPVIFYQVIFALLLSIIINKLEQKSRYPIFATAMRVIYYLQIGFVSFQIISLPILIPTLLISLKNALLITAFYTGLQLDHQDSSWKYRLAPLLYFTFLLITGIAIILEINSPILALSFFLIPLIGKLANHQSKLNKYKYERYNFVIFMFLLIIGAF